MVKKQRYPKVGKTKAKLGTSGRDVCGGEIVQVNSRGTKACWKCGRKAH